MAEKKEETSMDRKMIASELVRIAGILAAAEDEGEEQEDPQFAQIVRDLKQNMQKLTNKKSRRLKQFGISDMIRPNNTVEDLINVLRRVVGS